MNAHGEIMRLAGMLSKAHGELADFADTIEASRTKGWALAKGLQAWAKSLQAQIDILLPVVQAAADDDDEYGIGPKARAALEALAAHRET